MVSSVGGSSGLTVPSGQVQQGASGGALKKSLDVEKQAGQNLIDLINKSSITKGNTIDIKA